MFLATINKPKQLLHLGFIGEVKVEELARGHVELVLLIEELNPGFRLITDLERLDSMGVECAAEIGKVMELCDQKGVEFIVRIIPDPMKDIGLGILSYFHYSHRPRTSTCGSMPEAAKLLDL
jgi:anti-anti-sigma regulatory factor